MVATTFDVTKKEDFTALEDAYKAGNLYIPKWQFDSKPLALLCYEDMATKA